MCKVAVLAAVASATLASSVSALPILVDYNSLDGRTLEDFEGLQPGELSSLEKAFVQVTGLIFLPPPEPDAGPFAFRGFSFVPAPAFITAISDEPPCAPENHCLATWSSPTIDFPVGGAPDAGGTFQGFDAGTTGFAVRLSGEPSLVSIIAHGGSGTASYELHGVSSLGMFDAQGLNSVEVRKVQFFDEIITAGAAVAPVPLPAAGTMLLVGIFGIAMLRRQVSWFFYVPDEEEWKRAVQQMTSAAFRPRPA